MALQGLATATEAAQPQPHHPRPTLAAGGFAMAGTFAHQQLKQAPLFIEGQGPMGTPDPSLRWSMAIKPGAAATPQPARQQAVAERPLAGGGSRLLHRGSGDGSGRHIRVTKR